MINLIINRRKLYSLLAFPLALIIVSIPWLSNYSGYRDIDAFTYVNLLDLGMYDESLKYSFSNIISYVKNEWVWGFFVTFLSAIGLSSKFIFFTFIPFLIYFILVRILIFKTNIYYCIFLIHPLLILFNFSQLRLALAISLFFYAYYFFRKNLAVFFILTLICIFMHTSMVLFVSVFYFISILLDRINRIDVKLVSLVLFGFLLAFLTGPFISVILGAIGDNRRSEIYSSNEWNSSYLSSVYWLSLLMVFFVDVYKRKIISFEVAASIVFISLVIISPFFTGGYPYRFLTAVLILIIIAISQLSLKNRILASSLLMISFIQQSITIMHWI
ncbi:EpsG family protein [Acinetobacter sp. CS-2]|uniref:EpsG family protein n=1 Tax=Acinetobacter sp. CS-2 TaxID=2798861 RepID=UPI0019048C50|nr:EpsG family protein [Acinetobacter sp. CS-2]QQN39474.1 EpsG family protein [Acinetobacter sp. CS-2]